jgi:integrase
MNTDQAVKKLREFIRLKHFAISTEDSYCLYVRQFCEHSKKMPQAISSEKRIESYLSIFAQRDASASAQNVAFNAVLFFYRHILGIEPKGINALRARRQAHIRNAPAPEDTHKILNFIKEHYPADVSLACNLIYGCGGRVCEPLNLRIRDINRRESLFIFRQAKQHKDRVVPIPCAVMADLDNQISLARNIWEREGNRWPVALPGRLRIKYPAAQFSWQWFWLFPARGSCVDKRNGLTVRWRMHEATIQRAVRRSAGVFGLSVLPHELRHGYATDCLNNGTNPRALQQVMGHKSLETTMLYCHAEAAGVKSPLDQ